MSYRIAVVGLGYVGLPVALGFSQKFRPIIGFDINAARVDALKSGHDWTGEADANRLKSCGISFTTDLEQLKSANVFIVCVPTPIHPDRRPDLGPLELASETVGRAIRPGALVVYESTVYPGVTEDICGAIIARVSGLKQGRDFKLGYSPERINPGDKAHRFESIVKVVAGEDEATTRVLSELYGAVVTAGVHSAPSIKVAETAKVLENTQRDLNIALMNELAIICDLMSIRTKDVLDAAETKWNFLKFSPGLVGGHCVGVDPYYLTSRAQEFGYHPEVILAGRRMNDSMGTYIARRVVRFLAESSTPLRDTRVGILGVTFKENVPDIRNSRVPDIVTELKRFGLSPLICDPLADAVDIEREYGLVLSTDRIVRDLDALVLAVPHESYRRNPTELLSRLRPGGVLIDVKSVLSPKDVPHSLRYWSL